MFSIDVMDVNAVTIQYHFTYGYYDLNLQIFCMVTNGTPTFKGGYFMIIISLQNKNNP